MGEIGLSSTMSAPPNHDTKFVSQAQLSDAQKRREQEIREAYERYV